MLLCLVGCGPEPTPQALQDAPEPVDHAKAQYDAAMRATAQAMAGEEANDGEIVSGSWQAGMGPDVDFAKVFIAPGSAITVSCAVKPRGQVDSTIGFTLDERQAAGPVRLFFDGEKNPSRTLELDEQGLFQTECHACSATFHAVIDAFKTRRKVEVVAADGKRALFGLHAADRTIPAACRSTRDLEFQ